LGWDDYLDELRSNIDRGVTDLDLLFQALVQKYLSADLDTDLVLSCKADMEQLIEGWYQLFGRSFFSLDSADQVRWTKVKRASKFGPNWDKLQHFSAGAGWFGKIGDMTLPSVVGEIGDEIKAWYGGITNTLAPHQVGYDPQDVMWGVDGARFAKQFQSAWNCRKLAKEYACGDKKLSQSFGELPKKDPEWSMAGFFRKLWRPNPRLPW
jgi:hypothetical protein